MVETVYLVQHVSSAYSLKNAIWVWLKIKQPGQTAGLSLWFHSPKKPFGVPFICATAILVPCFRWPGSGSVACATPYPRASRAKSREFQGAGAGCRSPRMHFSHQAGGSQTQPEVDDAGDRKLPPSVFQNMFFFFFPCCFCCREFVIGHLFSRYSFWGLSMTACLDSCDFL